MKLDAVTAYRDLLTRLQHLIANGEGDSEEADQLREAMDLPARQMSEEELRTAREEIIGNGTD